ncbi:uncharacterized protein [Halyomorpha halys]|uniref:uncharacterized protein isoform X4 n=1 Tax=Halyomorpha halys TaxID=286706 RepID=UPI0006D4FFF0|nr:uncharacterized protein LOC106677755 isoform X2 [Halyomorpha halys]
MKEQILRDSNHSQENEEESYDSYIEEDCVTSTPIKVKGRRSVSLLDISDIGSTFEKSKVNIYSDTIGSNSSLCKDSGYNHSESSLASEKCIDKEDVPFGVELRSKYVRLLEDLKFKDVMIAALHQSNHSLRLKIADAENKISDLRLKSESHCKCCTHRNSVEESAFDAKLPEKKKPETKYSVTPLVRNENCVVPTIPPSNKSMISSPRQREPALLPSDDAIIKVQQWQNNSYRECQKRLFNQIPPTVSSPPLDPRKIYIRPVPEPLPNTMSYMETSRALADAYRKRQEKAHDLVRVQMIGDQSVSVTPIQFPHPHRQRADTSKQSCPENEVTLNDTKQVNEKDTVLRLQKRHTLFGNLLINHQELISHCLLQGSTNNNIY